MDAKNSQCLVRDLDLTLQPRVAPRYKTWLPLATQQLRLRSLVQVRGYNLETDKDRETCWFYYTLHRSSMSSTFFTSELMDNANAGWAALEVPTIHATGLSVASEIVLRLWRRTSMKDSAADAMVFAWGISFTGLAYMGPKLSQNLDSILRDNSLILHFHGGYFAPPYCLLVRPDTKRYLRMSVSSTEIRESYTVVKLTSLRSKMQALKQQTESVQTLRERIASGDEIQSPKYKQTSLNRLLQPKKISREKKAEILRIRKELEVAKFRTKLLEQERVRKMGELRTLNQLHMSIMEENQDHGTELMERYRELNKDIERLREWRQSHMETREIYMQTTSKLAHRRRQLISELGLIYPINPENEKKYMINNVHLPDSEELESSNDTQVAVALGFVAHTTQMIANFLSVPTRYSILHYGSRSRVVDHITDSLPDNDRQFPLFARTKGNLQFHYAVYLLNKNIAQLRWYCGLPTADLRATLPNLTSLMINIKPNQPGIPPPLPAAHVEPLTSPVAQSRTMSPLKMTFRSLDSSKRTFSGSSLDTDMGNGKHSAPLTPPIQEVTSMPRSMSQLKSVKSGLGSSLDQGLDKPPHSLVLTKRSKRICKSEESAIDARHLSLPRESTSSDETLDDTVFENSATPLLSRERYAKITSIRDIERDIVILTPISVSKKKASPDATEDSGSTKQRSSNSISSCEMALSGSQNDIGESSPGSNGKMDSSMNGEYSLNEDDTIGVAKIHSTLINDEADGKSLSSSESTANARVPYDRDKSQETLTEITGRRDCCLLSKTNNSEDTLSNSCRSLDDKRTCNETLPIAVCGASSYPEKRLSRMAALTLRAYESDGRLDEKVVHDELDGICGAGSSVSSEEPSEYSQLLDDGKESTKFLSHARNKDHEVACEFRASTEYIDSIRRSSENVFARTEALASKKSSFKVMKPRI